MASFETGSTNISSQDIQFVKDIINYKIILQNKSSNNNSNNSSHVSFVSPENKIKLQQLFQPSSTIGSDTITTAINTTTSSLYYESELDSLKNSIVTVISKAYNTGINE